MQSLAAPDKINVGSLGNIVRQLHIHVVARKQKDPAWPGPVWGSGPARPYGEEAYDDLCGRFGRDCRHVHERGVEGIVQIVLLFEEDGLVGDGYHFGLLIEAKVVQ